jgi:hypothetical protein
MRFICLCFICLIVGRFRIWLGAGAKTLARSPHDQAGRHLGPLIANRSSCGSDLIACGFLRVVVDSAIVTRSSPSLISLGSLPFAVASSFLWSTSESVSVRRGSRRHWSSLRSLSTYLERIHWRPSLSQCGPSLRNQHCKLRSAIAVGSRFALDEHLEDYWKMRALSD